MGQSVLDSQSGNSVFYPDGVSSDEIEKSMSDFNSGTISEARPDWYTQYIKRPLQQMTGNANLDPIMTARATMGGINESLQPLTPFKIAPTPQEKEAFKNVSPAAYTIGSVGGQVPPFIALEAATSGIGGLLEGIPLVAKAMQGLNAAKEAGVVSEQGLKVAAGATKFGAVTGEYGALQSASEQNDTFGSIDWHDVSKEAAKQAGFGLTAGGVFSYMAKPLAELGSSEEVIAHSSKLMMASGSVMAAQAAANGASPRDVMLNFGMGSIMAGLHLHGELQEVRDASIQELINHQARYILGQTGGDEQAVLRVAQENTMNHAVEVINESNNGVIERNSSPEGSWINETFVPSKGDTNSEQKYKENALSRIDFRKEFNDPNDPELLDKLAYFFNPHEIVRWDAEQRLAWGNLGFFELKDRSEIFREMDFEDAMAEQERSAILDDDAKRARGIPVDKTVLDEVSKSKTLSEKLAHNLANQMVVSEGGDTTGKAVEVPGEKTVTGEKKTGTGPVEQANIQEVTGENVQDPKVAKAARDINKEFVRQGFKELSDEEQARFNPIQIKEQEEKVSDLITEDPEKAKRMATGKEPVPSDIQEQILFNAISKKAIAEKDFKTGMELAASPIGKKLSLAAQTMRAAQTDRGITHDPIKEIQIANNVLRKKAPKDAAKKETVLVKSAKKIVQDAAPKLSDWDNFLKEIAC